MDRSDAVRDFYERMPYPAPLTNLDKHRDLYKSPARRRALFHLIWPAERERAIGEILIAGCGTSQAARYALREPEARITAIDISETSLKHTRELQERYELENLELRQLPIERIRELRRSFDLIVCTGRAPSPSRSGLRSSRPSRCASSKRRDAPDGLCALWAHRDLHDAGLLPPAWRRDFEGRSARPRHDAGSAAGEPSDRKSAAPGERVPPARGDGRRASSSSGSRLHGAGALCLNRTLWPLVWTVVRAGALPAAVRSHRKNAPRRTARRAGRTPQHAAVELFRGTITRHSLVAYRSDRPKKAQPIRFADDQWRNYVPMRLPWAMCVRDRAPPGSVAVLLNPAHQHPDLVLPISAAQNHVLDQIDGTRTLGEIVQRCGTKDGADRARHFFEDLWRYDQIVFDASRAAADQNAA